MGNLKAWLIEVGIKHMGPSLIRASIAWVVALMAANAGLLATFGIVYDKVANTVTLHVGTLETWLLGIGLGLITASLRAAQYHTGSAIVKAVTPPPPEVSNDKPQ